MGFVETLTTRNAEFVEHGFSADLKILPSARTLIIGCVDPRVDPMDILELQPGEAAIIRNVGGRINPAMLETLGLLRAVSRAAGQEVGDGWNLIVLHHTDCGIVGCYHHAPDLLARHMGVTKDRLEALEITDPYKAVAVDVAALRANPQLPGGFTLLGLVYDVARAGSRPSCHPGLSAHERLGVMPWTHQCPRKALGGRPKAFLNARLKCDMSLKP